MAVAFKTQKIEFSNEIGPKDETLTFTFASTVKSAGAAISGSRPRATCDNPAARQE